MADERIDPKLSHLVRKCLSTNDLETRPSNADQVAGWLREKYREYQRKDLTKLTCQVQTILTNIEEKLKENGYDKEARAYDEHRERISNSTNSLNASLTRGYRKLQQNRDADEEANRALQVAEEGDLAEINDGMATMGSNDENNDGGLSKKRTRENASTSSTNHLSLEKRASKLMTAGKSTKRKKAPSMRRKSTKSGAEGPGIPGRDGGANTCEPVPRPTERYSDLGGMGDVLTQIRQLVEYPLVRPELYRHLGVDPPRGVLLRGPPG